MTREARREIATPNGGNGSVNHARLVPRVVDGGEGLEDVLKPDFV
jgi:hypothetical protein